MKIRAQNSEGVAYIVDPERLPDLDLGDDLFSGLAEGPDYFASLEAGGEEKKDN